MEKRLKKEEEMSALEELEIIETEALVFKEIVAFQKEISNPMVMKKEMDQLIGRLSKNGHKHCHKVITKVIGRNEKKKTITLQIMVPISDSHYIQRFLDKYDDYFFMDHYKLGKSIKISIPNDMNEFKRAVDQFVKYAHASHVNEMDLGSNPIIEIAKVDMNGTIVGFDLHMEKITEEES
ncbi:hypothetical protein [Bacillus xiapuensis]|uniref:hypothetical protein n=1 Tax=Bacillus xiapuensis TaxID=2014075 RepID=UPI000C24C563|nr:hypothetical protein [Bacillus xiapuensis]